MEKKMKKNGFDISSAVRDTIYRATIALDDQKWVDWLDLCDEEFSYEIKSFSPEINKDMTYMAGSRNDLVTLTEMLPKHNTDHSPLHRHTSVYAVDVAEDGKSANAISSFVIYQNMLDGINSHIDSGESRLFLIGKYIDQFKIDGDQVKFVNREVRLDNRRLDKGSHWPI